ncbi:MAG: hypothetical protein ACRDCM_07245, partial [Plesiomonas shigelloides]
PILTDGLFAFGILFFYTYSIFSVVRRIPVILSACHGLVWVVNFPLLVFLFLYLFFPVIALFFISSFCLLAFFQGYAYCRRDNPITGCNRYGEKR